MDDFLQQGFVQHHTLGFTPMSGTIVISGSIACLGRIVICVYKRLDVLDEEWVQTRKYSYNAFVAGHETFLRHDNAHVHPGHADAHHFHEEDWKTGAPAEGSPVW